MPVGILLLLCLSVSLHELGHAFAMRKYGIQIQEICLLGLGGPRLLSFKIRKLFGETPITIRAFLLGGFVAPTRFSRLRVYTLDYEKAGHIYGGGIAVNFLFGACLMLAYSILEGRFDTQMLWAMCFLVTLGLLPRYTFRLYPILGLYILVGWMNDLMSNTAIGASATGNLINTTRSIALNSNSLSETLYLGGLISVALGILNCIPVLPADGGRIIERMLCSISYKYRKLIIGIYKYSMIPLLIIILLFITSRRP